MVNNWKKVSLVASFLKEKTALNGQEVPHDGSTCGILCPAHPHQEPPDCFPSQSV